MTSKISVIILSITCFAIFSKVNAQNIWQPLGGGMDDEVYVLLADTVNNVLYAGGEFTYAGGVKANGIAKWDGNSWDSLGSGFHVTYSQNPAQIATMHLHENSLYVGGFFDSAGSVTAKYIARWNGSRWDSLGKGLNSIVFDLHTFENELLATGQFYKSGDSAVQGIAKWKNNSWEPFDTTNWAVWGGYKIMNATMYNNEFYISGILKHRTLNISKIARWNGTNWNPVPNNIPGDLSWIRCMQPYQGDLIVAGYFSMFEGGKKIDNLARLSDNQWSSIGDMIGEIRKIITYKDKLVAVGDFSKIDDHPISRIAVWDGDKWCGLESEFEPIYYVNDIVEFNDQLYIAGWFVTINNDTLNHIARLNEDAVFSDCQSISTSVQQPPKPALKMQVFPNPSNDQIWITFEGLSNHNSATAYTLQLYNLDGKLILQTSMINNNSYRLVQQQFPAGIYVYKIWGKDQLIHTGKVVFQ